MALHRGRNAMRVLACLLLLLVAPVAQAQMYKCPEGGRTRYADKPITDCKNVQVTGQPKAPAAAADEPKAAAKKGKVSKERVEIDRKCASLRQERARLQRAPDSADREQRMQQLRGSYNACN